jgi:hypothetical protein
MQALGGQKHDLVQTNLETPEAHLARKTIGFGALSLRGDYGPDVHKLTAFRAVDINSVNAQTSLESTMAAEPCARLT